MSRRFTAVLFLAAASSLSAQNIPKPQGDTTVPVRDEAPAPTLDASVKQRIEQFFQNLRQKKVDGGYKALLSDSPLAKENPDLVTELVKSTTRVLDLTGDIGAAELLRVRGAGKTLREATYVLNGAKRPLRWRFYLYYSGGVWQILDTNVATEASGFFE